MKVLCIWLSITGIGLAMISEKRRLELREEAKGMFYHAYNSYMQYGFPSDEVKPISCKPKERDKKNIHNIGVNDVLGDYQLTLVDSVDTLVVLGDKKNFEIGIKNIIKHVNFNIDSRVQVFEVTIRMLGGLLSAHQFASSSEYGFKLDWYNNELLDLAIELGDRLLPAFYSSPTSIPFARVNLKYGMNSVETSETCTAGVTTLLLEFATLSRLSNNPIYEEVARDALEQVWDLRFNTGLFGNSLDLRKGKWLYSMSGIGAGVDSFFEYLLKSSILLNDDKLLDNFESSYLSLLKHTRDKSGFFYLNVNANNSNLINTWIDSLAAFFPGLQVLAGDLENGIKSHLTYFNIWSRFRGIPERFDLETNKPILNYYPLRPEFIESTYMLYQATKDPFYLKVGEMILNDLQLRFKCKCGYASMNNVISGDLDDRMESFFLSETLKYLYLLFDKDNYFNKLDSNMVFTTEGHLLSLPKDKLKFNSTTNTGIWKLKCDKYESSTFLRSSIIYRSDFDYIKALLNNNIDNEFNDYKVEEMGFCSIPNNDVLKEIINRQNQDLANLLVRDDLLHHFNEHDDKWKLYIKIQLEHKIEKQINNIQYIGMKSKFGNYDFKNKILPLTLLNTNHTGCKSYKSFDKTNMKGKIIIISRGDCTFFKKALLAQKAGAEAVLFINNDNEIFSPETEKGQTFNDIFIPSVLISKSSADSLIDLLHQFPNLKINLSLF